MAKVRIILVPEAEITFTRAEVQLLMKRSQHHYDGECRYVGRDGGFLFGIHNQLRACRKRSVERRLTFRQVDTLAKVVEPVMNGDVAECGALHAELMKVLRSLNEAYEQRNKEEK